MLRWHPPWHVAWPHASCAPFSCAAINSRSASRVWWLTTLPSSPWRLAVVARTTFAVHGLDCRLVASVMSDYSTEKGVDDKEGLREQQTTNEWMTQEENLQILHGLGPLLWSACDHSITTKEPTDLALMTESHAQQARAMSCYRGNADCYMCSCLGCMHSWGIDLPTGLSVRLWRNTLHSRDHFWYQHLLHSDCFFILDMYKRCYVNARTLNNKPRPGQTFPNTFTIMSDFAKLGYCKHRATTMRSIVDSFSWFLIVWLCLVGSGLIQRPKALFFYVHFWQFLALCHVLCARNKSAILSGPAPRYFFSCANIYANMSLDVDDM